MNAVFLLLYAFLKILFNLMVKSFELLFRGIVPEIITLLVSLLYWWANLSMLSAIFTWSFSVFKSLVPKCITRVSGFYLVLWTTYTFMWSVFESENCFTTNLFSLSDISQPFIYLIIESPRRTVTFLYCYRFFDFLSADAILSYSHSCLALLRETYSSIFIICLGNLI